MAVIGVCRLTGGVEPGTLMSSSIDVGFLGSVNVRRSGEREYYSRFLQGEFCEGCVVDDAHGGYPIVQWLVTATADASETALFDNAGDTGRVFNFTELAGDTVKFHLSFFRELTPTGSLVFRAYVEEDTDTGFNTGSLFWTSDVVSATGMYYLTGSDLAKPSGSKQLFLTLQRTGSVDTDVKGLSWAVEVF